MKICSALLFAITLLITQSQATAQTQTQVAATANSDIAEFVQAFNSSQPAALDAYLTAHLAPPPPGMLPPGAPPDDTAQSLKDLRQATGTIALAAVDALPRRIIATVKAARGGWYSLAFVKAPPQAGAHKFARIVADLGLPPRPANQSPNAYLKNLASAGYFSGTVLIARENGRPSIAAYGLSNRKTNTKTTPATLFNIGSLGKLFTTTAIYQLIESGKLHLTDTIGQWLPDYPNQDARAATIEQLLNMQSGIGDFFNRRFFQSNPSHIRTLQDYVPYFASDPLAFKPGQGQLYSNGGYIVLGLIIEKVSGENYYTYIQQHVFNPAGMHDSSYPTIDQQMPNRAIGYTRRWSDSVATFATPLRPALMGEPGRGSSAGGAYSTAGDLYKFVTALRNGALLKQRYDWNGPGNAYAGGTPGWNAAIDLEQGSTSIVLANLDPPVAENLVRQLQP